MLVTEEVYNQILTKIIRKEWAPGTKIPSEKQLCEMFGVSRVSIRSVLHQLLAKGMIYTRQGIGSFVANVNEDADDTVALPEGFTEEDISLFFEFRQTIEFKAIDLFVACAEEGDYNRLLEIISQGRNCDNDFETLCQCDYAFHMAIIEGSKNKFFVQAILANKESYLNFIRYGNRVMNENPQSWANNHYAIYQNLLNNQPEGAKRITLEVNVLRRMLRIN